MHYALRFKLRVSETAPILYGTMTSYLENLLMTTQNVVLPLPESLYLRLQQTAQATRQTLTDVLLHAVQVGSPPNWEESPAMFQADLAALDRLDDESLWRVVRLHRDETEMDRHQELLDRNSEGTLTESEHTELVALRTGADRLMLRKAHAAALLRWRGHTLPPSDQL